MSTEKPRFTITVDDKTLERVSEYQSEAEYGTRARAIESLIIRGLDSIGYTIENLAPMPRVRNVPRVGTIACGAPIFAEENIDGYDTVPSWIKCDFTLKAKGDSMTGARIYDGDIVCIRKQERVENGQIAAVLIGDEATLKRIRYIDGGIVLLPENSKYAPTVFTGDDVNNVQILGLATHFISKLP